MTTTTRSIVVTAPFSGTLVPLSEVPDETFASGVLGEGIAIEPSDGLFCSPVDGTVETIAETKHAIGFAADNGLEILVHVGLETVSLNGEGFEILVKEGGPGQGRSACGQSRPCAHPGAGPENHHFHRSDRRRRRYGTALRRGHCGGRQDAGADPDGKRGTAR